jgi:hypothetical protein
MLERIRTRLTYANVISTLSLFLVLGGGTALAAYVVSSNSQIGPGTISGHNPPTGAHANIIGGSVNGSDLAAAAITTGKLANNAVTGAKVGNNSLTGADIDESTLSPGIFHSGPITMALGDPDVTVTDNGTLRLKASCQSGAVDNSAQLSFVTTGSGAEYSYENWDVSYAGDGGTGHAASGETGYLRSDESGTFRGGTFIVHAANGRFITGNYLIRGGAGCKLNVDGIVG